MSLSHQTNGRFNVSFVTSQHSIKTGVFWMYGLGGGQRARNVRAPEQVGGLPVTYTFLNGRPIRVSKAATLSKDEKRKLQFDAFWKELGRESAGG